MPKQAKNLKVMLSEENTKRVRAEASKKNTTPPRVVNLIIATTITGLRYTRK